MTVKELIALLKTFPEDALVGNGNSAITDVNSLPSYYDGRHQLPQTDDRLGFHVRACSQGTKVQLHSRRISEIIDDRLPLYTPLITTAYNPDTKESREYDQGLEGRYPGDPNYKDVMIAAFAQHHPNPLGSWDAFWAAFCGAYGIVPDRVFTREQLNAATQALTQHEQLQLRSLEEKHRGLWNDSPPEGEPHLTYGDLGKIAYDIMAYFPQARKAARVAHT